jgi:hypothetical protein
LEADGVISRARSLARNSADKSFDPIDVADEELLLVSPARIQALTCTHTHTRIGILY